MPKKTTLKQLAEKKKLKKKARSPFRVLLGHVSRDGKLFTFERKQFDVAEEAMAMAQGALDKGQDSLRQIQILINPEAM